MSDGFNFLGFRIQWRRKKGTEKWHVYTFIGDRPIRSLKAKIRAMTNRKSQQDRPQRPPGPHRRPRAISHRERRMTPHEPQAQTT